MSGETCWHGVNLIHPPPDGCPLCQKRRDRIDYLERRRKATIADMMIKAEGEDFHGVQDCASDLRDVDNELAGLRYEE